MIFSVDDCYQTEAPFQIFWFVANSSIIVVLTILIKTMRAKDYDQHNDLSVKLFGTSLNLNLHKILNLKAAVIENNFFIEAIATILLTGILSLLIFLLMKRFKCAQPNSPPN